MDNIYTIRAAYTSAKKGRTSIVFFRIGTFYIIIFDDAKLVSKILDLTVKTKECDGCVVEYLSFAEDELFNIVRDLNSSSIIPCTIIETEEFDFLVD
jgi:DNA mismatch repair ATPase MutS